MKKFIPTFLLFIVLLLFLGCSSPEEPVFETESTSSGTSTPVVLGDNLTKGFMLDAENAFGTTVLCNGKSAKEFIPRVGETVNCLFKDLTLATFTGVEKKDPDQGLQMDEADQFLNQATKAANAVSLIKTMAKIEDQTVEFELTKSEELSFVNFFKNDLGISADEFAQLLDQADADKKTNTAPSTHTTKIDEAVTEGASTSFKSDFISVNAEDNLIYTPTKVIVTTGVLTDNLSRKVEGVEYYTPSSRGETNEKGEFKFSWGEEIIFGIDTFELGKVRGNKTDFKLSDLGSGHVGRNVERLVQRFGQISGSKIKLPDIVQETFAKYPNVINEIIKLSLSEDTILDLGSTQQSIEGEFLKQFEEGEAQKIDKTITDNISNSSSRSARGNVRLTFRSATKTTADDSTTVLGEVKKLWGITSGWKQVTKFHVFHDAMRVRGSNTGLHKGNARAQSVVYVSNAAFPIMMARNDVNYWIPFGEKAAFDELGLGYITESPSKVIPDNVSINNATFNLPFISIGEIGLGKVMMMGNSRYNSILVCPTGYSWNGAVSDNGTCKNDNDSSDMKHFFQNTFKYLGVDPDASPPKNVGTNIPYVYFKNDDSGMGEKANFVINQSAFNANTVQLESGGFKDLEVSDYPLLVINGFEYRKIANSYSIPMSADVDNATLSEDDIDDLIKYVGNGGNILIMESIAVNTCNSGYGLWDCKLSQWNPEPIGRLLDSAGLAVGHPDTVVLNGSGPKSEVIWGANIRPRSIHTKGVWLIEKYTPFEDKYGIFDDVENPIPSYKIHDNGTVSWEYLDRDVDPGIYKPTLEVASWEIEDKNSAEDWQITQEKYDDNTTVYAFVEDRGQADLETQKQAILNKFKKSDGTTPAYEVCDNSTYHYEINCLEYRPTNGIEVWGDYNVPKYTELALSEDVAKAMIKAGDLGTNIQRLYQHELYFRTKGKKGIRLSGVDVHRIYKNMTVWLWNTLQFTYDSSKEDELGFKVFTEFLNCYSNDQHGGNTTCPASLKKELQDNNMIYGPGDYENMMNPSYPVHFKEKPVTRLMLGRSYWDLNIKVDLRVYPGVPSSTTGGGGDFTLNFAGTGAGGGTGNLQSTGQWAVAHQAFTVSTTTTQPVSIIIGLNDDLTGLEKHEKRMQRPPRISKRFTLNKGSIGQSHTYTVPYGGLIYASTAEDNITLTLSNTIKAPWYKLSQDGTEEWINPIDSPAPLGEIESKTFIYTSAKKNLQATNYSDVKKFAEELDTFSSDLNDFYARDEDSSGSLNRKSTDPSIPNHKHRVVNDIAISKGGAHSGYPVMWINFDPDSTKIAQNPLNSWTLWHEVGHNAAESPFAIDGSGEVVNNLLGLYMQDKHLKKMNRVERSLRIVKDQIEAETGNVWGAVGGGIRLLMFAQIKIWADKKFDIKDWYSGTLPSWYDETEGMKGWNLFKLMHRLTRNQNDPAIQLKGSENKCYGQNLNVNDRFMLCTSYAAQKDFTDFFDKWNPGSQANLVPGETEPIYVGGITEGGKSAVKALGLPKPTLDPISIESL